MRTIRWKLVGALLLSTVTACGGAPSGTGDPAPPGKPASTTYWVYVGAESEDLLHRIRFHGDSAVVERTVAVGEMPGETEGPHGLMASRGGRHLYMTTGHGVPDGKLWKLEAGPDTAVSEPLLLGRFPATLDVTPDGLYALVANFKLHGEKAPSSVSVVYTPDMVEVARLTTCVQPHGARLDPRGLFLYSACVFDDQVVEIDTRSFEVSRRFSVDLDVLSALDPDDVDGSGARGPSCGPTWALPDPVRPRLYVACNGARRIMVVDTEAWRLLETWPTGEGPYNLAVTPDGGLLVATLKQGDGVEFFDPESGESLARRPSSNSVTHGVVISPDGRYAFTSVEGVGADPGRVDVWDLRRLERVATVEVGQQAGGIAFWKMAPGPGSGF